MRWAPKRYNKYTVTGKLDYYVYSVMIVDYLKIGISESESPISNCTKRIRYTYQVCNSDCSSPAVHSVDHAKSST